MIHLHRGMEVFDGETLAGIPGALRECDRKKLNVSLELELKASLDGEHIEALKQSIQANERITTVKFNLHGQWEDIGPSNRQAVASLVQAAERLPNLQELIISGDYIPVPAITSLLANASKLHTLKLEQFRNLKSCDTRVLEALCDTLRGHSRLKSLTIQPRIMDTRCEPQEEALISFLLEALADGPSLEYLSIETNVPTLSGPSVDKLCRSPSLHKLELCPRREAGPDVLEALANNLQVNIQELVVSSTFSDQSTTAILQLLETNTTIHTLTLISQDSRGDDIVIQPSLQRIADSLRTNTSLVHLTIPCGNPLPNIRILQSFVSVFETNFTLHTLEIFHDMTKIQRITFEEINGLNDDSVKAVLLLGKRIEYFTLLNRSGRGELLGNAASVGRDQWVEKLVEFNYSVDRLYFFLRTNPALCCHSQGGLQRRSPKKTSSKKRGRLSG